MPIQLFSFRQKKTGTVKYEVHHLQQNTADDNYTQVFTDIKFGTPGQNTEAEAKSYSGFTAPLPTEVIQKVIEQNGSTVIEIKYNREPITLTLAGDERLHILSPSIAIRYGAKWADVEAKAKEKVSLKSEWDPVWYDIYEWRLTDENGEFITDTTEFSADTTVYAVTNYTAFKIKNGVVSVSYRPKGKIIIPAEKDGVPVTEVIGYIFDACEGLTQVRFPKSLKKIANGNDYETYPYYSGAFCKCSSLQTVDLSVCTGLTEIGNNSFRDCTSLTEVKFPENLQTIGGGGLLAVRG